MGEDEKLEEQDLLAVNSEQDILALHTFCEFVELELLGTLFNVKFIPSLSLILRHPLEWLPTIE